MKKYLENIPFGEKIIITLTGSNESLRIDNPKVVGDFLEGSHNYDTRYPDIDNDRLIMRIKYYTDSVVVRIDSITSIRRAAK